MGELRRQGLEFPGDGQGDGLAVEATNQGGGLLVGDQLPLIDDADGIAEQLGFFQVMGGQQDGGA